MAEIQHDSAIFQGIQGVDGDFLIVHIGPIGLGNYNDLTATSLEIMVNKGNHPKMALFQVSEILQFTQIGGCWPWIIGR